MNARCRAAAEPSASTRQRIVDAAIVVHGRTAIGTYEDIAREAGVERRTLRRHFPDPVELLRTCTTYYDRSHPAPDARAWLAIQDPVDRLRVALTQTYGYYADNESHQRNGRLHLTLRPESYPAYEHYVDFGMRSREAVASGWGLALASDSTVLAAIGHALDFNTWQSLRRDQGLTTEQAVELMIALVVGAAR